MSFAGKCFYGTGEIGGVRDYPELDEDSAPMGIDFPAELVGLWECAAEGVDATRIRHVRLRSGVVLGASAARTATDLGLVRAMRLERGRSSRATAPSVEAGGSDGVFPLEL